MSSLHTLGRWTRDRARLTPEKIAVEDRSITLDYARLDARSELPAQCTNRLARFKVPREVRIVRSIPRSSADKVLRRKPWPEGTE